MLKIFTELGLAEDTGGNLSKMESWNPKIKREISEVFIMSFATATGISGLDTNMCLFHRIFKP